MPTPTPGFIRWLKRVAPAMGEPFERWYWRQLQPRKQIRNRPLGIVLLILIPIVSGLAIYWSVYGELSENLQLTLFTLAFALLTFGISGTWQLTLPNKAQQLPLDGAVFFLRSFQQEGMNNGDWFDSNKLERILGILFHSTAPLITLGNPADVFPQAGISRGYVGTDWQSRVQAQLAVSKWVLVQPYDTPALLAELGWVKEQVSPHQVLLVFPLNGRRSHRQYYERCRQPLAQVGIALPDRWQWRTFWQLNERWEAFPLQPRMAWRIRWQTVWLRTSLPRLYRELKPWYQTGKLAKPRIWNNIVPVWVIVLLRKLIFLGLWPLIVAFIYFLGWG
ncbi:MAG: hypothetical protein AAFQ98_15350 [Bacteroidota bacterium]